MANPTIVDFDDTAFTQTDAATPQTLDNAVAVADADEDWTGGTLVVAGLLTGDVITIPNSGNITYNSGTGEVSWGGTVFATADFSVAGQVTFTFDSDAVASSIEELVEVLQYSTTAISPVITRTLTYTLTDANGGTGSDTVAIGITADATNNNLSGTAGGDDIGGGDGDDILKGNDGNDELAGGNNNDTLVGGAGDDLLLGGAGNDSLNGGVGADDMAGGDGNDTYTVDDAGDDVVEASGEGTDLVRSTLAGYTLTANVENLTLLGSANINGTGNSENNVITGNSGANTLLGADGNDTLSGGAGADSLSGGAGSDTLNGGNDDDSLNGEADNDVLNGNAGNDTLIGGGGADAMTGGGGDDSYYIDNAGDTVTEAANQGTDTVHSDLADYILGANVENLVLESPATNGTGNSLANVITGNSAANTLSGADGNDTLNGNGDDDVLNGGNGNDSLNGGAGADAMDGGAGNDIFYVDNAGDTVADASGYDKVYANWDFTLAAGVAIEEVRASGGSVALTGNALDNNLFGGVGVDALYGGDGNDTLDGGTNADFMAGSTGNDVYYVDNASDIVFEDLGNGTDQVRTTLLNYALESNVENLVGLLATGQHLTGNTLHNQITGGAGDDILAGGLGDDVLYGGLGADRLDGGLGGDDLVGGAGDDTYIVDDAGDQIHELAAGGIDTIRASLDWTLEDEVENLVLTGTAVGGGGNAKDNVITGNSEDNDLSGYAGTDTLNGLAGDDLLEGGDDNDILNGGSGDDILVGGLGADAMAGGSGDDTYYVDNAGDTAVETAGGGDDGVYSTVTYTLGVFVESLILGFGAGDIDGTGNALDNLIVGNEGANVLSGLSGRDYIDGGEGADTLYGGDGNDYLDDGFDDDVDYLYGGAGNDQLVGAEGDFLYGGTGNDIYAIGFDDITVVESSGEGTDTVYAIIDYTLTDNVEKLYLDLSFDIDGTGNALGNTIGGNFGDNVLRGMAGNDTIDGWTGDDTIIGGAGNDRMTGGADADTFVVLNSDMVSTVGGGIRQADTILDLNFSDGDRIDLSDIDANINLGGDQDFYFVSSFSRHAGEAKLTYNGTNTILQLDVDGDGKADYQLNIQGVDATGGTILGSASDPGGGWLGVMDQ